MDADAASKISKLAKSMKDLHLAGSMEEAYARAKEIILSTAKEGDDKSIGEMFNDYKKEHAPPAPAVAEVPIEVTEEAVVSDVPAKESSETQANVPEETPALQESSEVPVEVLDETPADDLPDDIDEQLDAGDKIDDFDDSEEETEENSE